MLTRNIIPAVESALGCTLDYAKQIGLLLDYNKSERHLVWANGSQWWMVGLDEPESAEGMNVDWIWADEFRLVGGSGPVANSKQIASWMALVRRLRGSVQGRYVSGLWVTTTPDAPKSVLYNHFEDRTSSDFIPDSRVYRWGIDENPTLPEKYRDEVKRAHGDPNSGLYKRFVKGLFAEMGGGTFSFDGSRHIVSQLQEASWYRGIVYGVDFGWTNPAVIVVIGFDGDGRAYILEEFYQARASDETLIHEAKELQSRWGRGVFWCDRSEPAMIQKMVLAHLQAKADESKRDDGIRTMGGRFAPAGDGLPRLFVHESCVNWISEVQTYDENVKVNDHAMDATRYALSNEKAFAPLRAMRFG